MLVSKFGTFASFLKNIMLNDCLIISPTLNCLCDIGLPILSADRIGKPISQRQLRVGEMIKQSLSMIFLRNEAKVPNLETNTITVTEVRMSSF